MSNIRPLHDRVVIRRVEEETKTAGGILLPGLVIKYCSVLMRVQQ